ncbi:MAG: lytic murein transglycosylase [Patescibacteria group bacterium]
MWWRFLASGALVLIASSALAQTSVEDRKRALEAELAEVEKEIAAQTTLLRATQRQGASLKRDIDLLTYELNQSKLKIKAKKLEIERLGGDITKKIGTIADLEARIEREKLALAELLRQTRDSEGLSFVEVMLDGDRLSTVFANVNSFTQIEAEIKESFANMRATKQTTEAEKVSLEKRRNAEIDARKVIEEEQAKIAANEKEKQRLLGLNKNQQVAYQKVLTERERKRTEIRSALFKLRGSTAISFGEALDHANFVSGKTGVRPAFLMAIITQESNLGENVGTCNRPGDPLAKGWRNILKPSRDHAPFLAITRALGLDPDIVPLSCPIGSGWGGAMGPAQFIPSTWQTYESRISSVTGNRPPSPWTVRDAFTGSGLFLADLGADAGGYTAERTAALKYYAGGNWKLSKNAFYGNEVMDIASGYQNLINTLQNS